MKAPMVLLALVLLIAAPAGATTVEITFGRLGFDRGGGTNDIFGTFGADGLTIIGRQTGPAPDQGLAVGHEVYNLHEVVRIFINGVLVPSDLPDGPARVRLDFTHAPIPLLLTTPFQPPPPLSVESAPFDMTGVVDFAPGLGLEDIQIFGRGILTAVVGTGFVTNGDGVPFFPYR